MIFMFFFVIEFYEKEVRGRGVSVRREVSWFLSVVF